MPGSRHFSEKELALHLILTALTAALPGNRSTEPTKIDVPRLEAEVEVDGSICQRSRSWQIRPSAESHFSNPRYNGPSNDTLGLRRFGQTSAVTRPSRPPRATESRIVVRRAPVASSARPRQCRTTTPGARATWRHARCDPARAEMDGRTQHPRNGSGWRAALVAAPRTNFLILA